MPDPLPAELEAALAASAGRRGRFGDRVVFFAETGSTNDDAAAQAERGAPEGTVVVAGRSVPAAAVSGASGSRRPAPGSTCRSCAATPGRCPF